jgi:hypothetical protein
MIALAQDARYRRGEIDSCEVECEGSVSSSRMGAASSCDS